MTTTLLFSYPRIFRPSYGPGFELSQCFFLHYYFQRNFQSCLDPQKQARGYKHGEIFELLTLMEMSMISPQHILKITTMSLLAVKQPLLLIRNYYFVEAPLQGNLLRGIDNKTVRKQEISRLHRPVYICSLLSNTHYITTKWFKIAVFLDIIFPNKYFLNGIHIWPILFVKVEKL